MPSRKGAKKRFAAFRLSRKAVPDCPFRELDASRLKLRPCLGHCGRQMLTDHKHRVCADCTRMNESHRAASVREDGCRIHRRPTQGARP